MKKLFVTLVVLVMVASVSAHHLGNSPQDDWSGNEERVHNGQGEGFLPPGMEEPAPAQSPDETGAGEMNTNRNEME